jgi:hypothetical protein
VTQSRESWTPDSRSPDRVRTVRSWRDRVIDLWQGYIMISAIGDGTCCILVRRYAKSRVPKDWGPDCTRRSRQSKVKGGTNFPLAFSGFRGFEETGGLTSGITKS